MAEKREYEIVTRGPLPVESEKQMLNEMGEKGWKLAAVVHSSSGSEYYFERKKTS